MAPWIAHTGLAGGPVFVAQDQFDNIYAGLGWRVTSAPTGAGIPASELLHYAGDWQPSYQYQPNDVVRTPGGGLLRFYQQQTTDTVFSETGGQRLVVDGGTGGGSGDILSF